ncbi:hypothetical protein HPB48_020004 [Haemaphysalis longicornis]|uniref:Uncharacterized protein n=1 Tax=Haemaphysalis longicornis TaxID=44386 RepID=A0A9J6H065_HAELO|nr:hypothetical protein HPB48_020004 [Haemaphysalis longicornis]
MKIKEKERIDIRIVGGTALCLCALLPSCFLALLIAQKIEACQDKEALSRTLNENNLYGRVQLEWTDHDVTGLAASLLLQPTQCSIDLELTTETLSCASFQYVCKALSSSHLARSLTVYLSKVMPGHLESLSDALKKNVSLKGLKLIEEAHESRGSAVRAADGLRFSTSVSNLEIKCISGMELDDVRRLKYLIAEARSLNAIEISSTFRFYSSYAYILSEGVLCNPFITSFRVSPGFVANPDTEFNEPLIRNNARLSRAARFVLRRNTGKLCAEAFELFRSKASLIERVKAVSGMSDSDAEAAVKSAEQFLSDNYFFINQVVRDKLECLPGEGTQIDQLNRDCLRLITRYLKISDVIVK